MAENITMRIRQMQRSDIVKSLLLSIAEGWNQTEKDWDRLAGNRNNICLVAEYGNRIIGTATAMKYKNEVAWIGMVLVDKEFRGRGISKMLLTDLLSQTARSRSVKLDATPAGQPVYEKFGFVDEYIIRRLINPSVKNFYPEITDINPEPVQFKDLPEIAGLDHIIFGAERPALLGSLFSENPEKAWMIKQEGKIAGFALGRRGTRYHQIGPVFADNENMARSLISKSLGGLPGLPVVADVPSDKAELISWLNSAGFVSQRHFVRMYRHANPLPGIPKKQFLICGPEFG